MAEITVDNKIIDVDIREELEQFDWVRPTWNYDKLIAASPFRYDTQPSFYVYLEDTPTAKAGSWGDSGAIDSEFARGGIIKLLSFLRAETTQETIDYLSAKYGDFSDSYDNDTLRPLNVNWLQNERVGRANRRPTLSVDLTEYQRDYPIDYFAGRGVTTVVQRLMRTGFDRRRNAVVIPWFNADGKLANVKYRRIDSKAFWYERGGTPIRELVYGLDVIYKYRKTTAVLVEGEIDAMYLMSVGFASIATGGAENFNVYKAQLIAKSPLEEVVIMGDHDEAGQRMKREAVELLSREGLRVRVAGYPFRYGDPNEIRRKELEAYVRRARLVRQNWSDLKFLKIPNY